MLALIPILLVIGLLIKTKNAYSSLLIGTIIALLIFTGFNPFNTLQEFINIVTGVLSDNALVLIYTAVLGIYMYLLDISKASHYFARFAIRKLKNKRQTLFVTILLGIFCYIDDYLNIITVNTVMKPVTDKMKISRAKLAYIVDATTAPVSLILGIIGSSWTCLFMSSLPETSTLNGFSVYVKTVPFIIYPFLTFFFMFMITGLNFDFGKMKKLELEAEKKKQITDEDVKLNKNLRIIDLILPILIVPIVTVSIMLYTGGILNGISISEAFLNCDAVFSALAGLIVSIIFMLLLYIPRKIINIKQTLESVSSGFENMATAILLLILAWTFAASCGEGYLNFTPWLGDLIIQYNIPIAILPFILYFLAYFITFGNGFSWATIALLIPLVLNVFGDNVSYMFLLSLGALVAGAVTADHNGALSDTTLLSAKISECNYMDHVISQLQYTLPVMLCTALFYLLAGFISYIIALVISVTLLIILIFTLKHLSLKKS